MRNEIKKIVEDHIDEIDKDDYINVIAAAAKNGFDCVVELRDVFKTAGIDMKPFDEQFTKMLTTYRSILMISNELVRRMK